VTPEQCVEARKQLGWSRGDLAGAAEIPVRIVEMFEAHDLHGLASCEIYMRDAFEAAGIKFPPIGADWSRAPNAVIYVPPETRPPRPRATVTVEQPHPLASMRAFLERTFGG
jgi:hypothetical protein